MQMIIRNRENSRTRDNFAGYWFQVRLNVKLTEKNRSFDNKRVSQLRMLAAVKSIMQDLGNKYTPIPDLN